jgi:voltage-gated potassium channel
MNTAEDVEFRLSDFVNLFLSLLVLVVVGFDLWGNPSREVSRILRASDTLICLYLMGDFFWRFWHSRNRMAFMKWGWLDFLAIIPAVPLLRWGRLIRVILILRMLKAVYRLHRVFHPWLRSRCQTGVSLVLLTTFSVLLASTCLVLVVETAQNSNIKTAEEALWWSVSTITTVGYGDRYPVTTAGRMVGMVLMFTGVGLFGMLSGMVATLFLGPPKPAEPAVPPATLDDVMKEVQALRKRLDEGKPERSADA